jgi:hypothetical protein
VPANRGYCGCQFRRKPFTYRKAKFASAVFEPTLSPLLIRIAEIWKGLDDHNLGGVPESTSNPPERRRRNLCAGVLNRAAHRFFFPQNCRRRFALTALHSSGNRSRMLPELLYPSLDAISLTEGGLSSARYPCRMASRCRRLDLVYSCCDIGIVDMRGILRDSITGCGRLEAHHKIHRDVRAVVGSITSAVGDHAAQRLRAPIRAAPPVGPPSKKKESVPRGRAWWLGTSSTDTRFHGGPFRGIIGPRNYARSACPTEQEMPSRPRVRRC